MSYSTQPNFPPEATQSRLKTFTTTLLGITPGDHHRPLPTSSELPRVSTPLSRFNLSHMRTPSKSSALIPPATFPVPAHPTRSHTFSIPSKTPSTPSSVPDLQVHYPQGSPPVDPPKPRKFFLPPRIVRSTSTEEVEIDEPWVFVQVEDASEPDYSSASSSSPSRDQLSMDRLNSLPILPKRGRSTSPDNFLYDDGPVSARSQGYKYGHENRQYSGDSISSYRGTTKPSHESKVEPDDLWKKELRARIEDNLQSMVQDAKRNFEAELKKFPVGLEERGRIAAEYSEAMANIRRIAAEAFRTELERERQERRWAAGQAMLPNWDLSLKQEQQQIMDKIKGSRGNKSAPSSDIEGMSHARNVSSLSPTKQAWESWAEHQPQEYAPPTRARSVGTRDVSGNGLKRHRSNRSSPGYVSRSLPKPEIWKPSISPEDDMKLSTPYAIGRNGSTLSFRSMNSVKTTERARAGKPVVNNVMSSLPSESQSRELESEKEQRGRENRHFVPLRTPLEVGLIGDENHLNGPATPISWGYEGERTTIHRSKTAASSSSKLTSPSTLTLNSTESFAQYGHRPPLIPASNPTTWPSSSMSPPPQRTRMEQVEIWKQEEHVKQPMDTPEASQRLIHSLELEPDHTWSEPIITKLKPIFHDKVQYKHLLSRRGLQAQRLLDLLQTFMNVPNLDEHFRNDVVTAMQRLSKDSGLYPKSFDLKDAVQLEGDGPVTAGSFADIYKGRFRNQCVCLKSIRVYQISRVNHTMKHVSREAILWGQLSHKNLLPFYGIYQHSPRKVCLVSPWVRNGHIREYLIRNPDADRAHLSSDVAVGISYLHGQGITHGDVKGANILVDDSGIACLADFGLSGVIDSQILNWTSQSSPASAGGSVRWQAPELLAPGHSKDKEKIRNSKSSDVYAWSCVCYEIFTSRDPFFEEIRNPAVTLKIIRGETPSCPPPTSPPRTKWGLTKPIWELMNRCWAYEPTKRPVIGDVVTAITKEASVDHRPNQSWGYIPPWRFRSAVSEPHQYPSVEDLEAMLSS